MSSRLSWATDWGSVLTEPKKKKKKDRKGGRKQGKKYRGRKQEVSILRLA